jgi:hypothetical protein
MYVTPNVFRLVKDNIALQFWEEIKKNGQI